MTFTSLTFTWNTTGLPAAQVREQVIREKVVKLVADSAVAVAPEAEEKKEDKAEETAE